MEQGHADRVPVKAYSRCYGYRRRIQATVGKTTLLYTGQAAVTVTWQKSGKNNRLVRPKNEWKSSWPFQHGQHTFAALKWSGQIGAE